MSLAFFRSSSCASSPTSQERPSRIHLMDELRGFAVFCMVFYHGFYTMAYLFGIPLGDVFFRFFTPAEPWFAGLFILISGISSALSRSNLLRGLKLLAVALGVTLVTALAVPQEIILFGILHFLSTCMIVFGLFQLLEKKRGAAPRKFRFWPLLVCALLFLLTMKLKQHVLFIPFGPEIPIPQELYTWGVLTPLGFPGPGFSSSDYFPLLPWCFVFFAGTVVGRLAKAGKFPAFSYKSRIPFFSFLGRHALLIYVLHQPVIYALCWAGTSLAALFS